MVVGLNMHGYIMDKIIEIEKDIKTLRTQGATNVALATLAGIRLGANNNTKSVFQTLYKVAKALAYARPTEPLAQNAVRFIFQKESKDADFYLERCDCYEKMIYDAKAKMGDTGVEVIHDGGIYLTHCHSSTVVSMFVKAWKMGKRFSVIATETRPLYQGRITVKELLDEGLTNVSLIIDDAVASLLTTYKKRFDAIFLGADLLSYNGFVNKIGTLGICLTAKKLKVPVYCTSILLKFDPRPFDYQVIEFRSGKEIWSGAPKGLKFYTPVFDYIPYAENIKIISEKGIIKGSKINSLATLLYSFIKEKTHAEYI